MFGILSNEDKINCNKCGYPFKSKNILSIDGEEYCKECSESVIKNKIKLRAEIKPEQIKDIIVTTTPVLQGYTIEQYLEPINIQVVLGIEMYRDIMASFRSWWGGRSKGLELELSNAFVYAIEDLKREAYLRGANAVIGMTFNSGIEVAGETLKANDKIAVVSCIGTAIKCKKQ